MPHTILSGGIWRSAARKAAAEQALSICRGLFEDPALARYTMIDLMMHAPEVDWLRKQGTTCVGPLWEVKLTYELDQRMKALHPPGHARPDPGTLAGGRYSYPDVDMLCQGKALRIELKAWWVQSEEASGRFQEPIANVRPCDVLLVPYWDFSDGKSGHPMLLDTLCLSAWEAAYLRNKRATDAGGAVHGRTATLANGKADTNYGKIDRLNHPEVNARSLYYPSPRRLRRAFGLDLPGTNEDFHVLFSMAEAAMDAVYPTPEALDSALTAYGESQQVASQAAGEYEFLGMFYRLWMHLSEGHKLAYRKHVGKNPSLGKWLARAWWVNGV